MPRNWTPSQLSAITTRGCNLLVSAGAGSGKTAVLTERIIRRLTDENDPAEITRMLTVTFTKAAAAELRVRIQSALNDALADQPANRRLVRQMLSLERANICTIHSFCLELLRENFAALGLPSDFRVADDAEITLLSETIMDELIEDYFSGKAPEKYPITDFESFSDLFTGTKSDDALAGIFLGLYREFQSMRESIGFIGSFADELTADAERDFGESRCGREIFASVLGAFEGSAEQLAGVIPELKDDPKLAKAYLPAFEAELAFLNGVAEAAEAHDYTRMTELFQNDPKVRLGVVRGVELSDSVTAAKELREDIREKRRRLAGKYFSLTPEAIRQNQLATAEMLRRLHMLLSAFEERFTAEKRRRSLVDFNDLERLTVSLLVGEDGRPTATARAAAERFDEIYIDEYQDVNSLQDAIFTALSSGSNRFMVGDIKQSIYAFRGAEPGIFSDYRSRYTKYGDDRAEDSPGTTIFLSDNFRCDEPVVRFANLVSGCLFTHNTRRVPFYREDLLVHSKTGAEAGEPVRVAVIAAEEDEESDELSAREAEYVAVTIERLLKDGRKDDGSPIVPGDVAILMRSARAQSLAFEEAFARHRIPLYNSVAGSFFENAEILLALCLLNVIDNPTRDIYLAGALKSPVFGFTLDELIRVRRCRKNGSLYDALCVYTEENAFEKGKRFLEVLAVWRRRAESMPVDRLIWSLYADTDLPAVVLGQKNDENAQSRRANLMMLYEYARRYEGSSLKGLYSFIRYLTDLIERKETLEPARVVGEGGSVVRLMTIHQSKGLEFPVVFLCGTGKKFNESDLRGTVVVQPDLGIALKLSDVTGFARFDTPVRQAIAHRLAESQLEEEMRVLYVAMTRARERLIVTGTAQDPEELLETASHDAAQLSRSVILHNGGYLRWILTALAEHSDDAAWTLDVIEPPSAEPPSGDNADEASGADTDEYAAENSTAAEPDKVIYGVPDAEPDEESSGVSVGEPDTESSGVSVGEPDTESSGVPDAEPDEESSGVSVAEPDEADPAEKPSDADWDALVRERFGFVYPQAAASRLPAKLSVSRLSPTVLDAEDDDALVLNEDRSRVNLTDKIPLFLTQTAEDTAYASPAERGTATHLFMQFCDLGRFAASPSGSLEDVIRDENARLCEEKFITPRAASLVELDRLAVFFRSGLFAEMSASSHLWREQRFNVNYPAADFTSDPDAKRALSDETVLVQGVIDCFFENPNGTLTLVDYKTDTIPRAFSRAEAEEMLLARHADQLGYYKTACEKISAKKVSRCVIWSFGLGDTVEVPVGN